MWVGGTEGDHRGQRGKRRANREGTEGGRGGQTWSGVHTGGQGGTHTRLAVEEVSLRIRKVDEDQQFTFAVHSFIQQVFRATGCVLGTDPMVLREL